ncbi:MAG: hypothetical protein Ta2E_08030 [Mycoplasmoidaceae bacterium]|nr:MAG: hypothetical protein Ta2E_08030 [Mycoplasmoidaceae bacterium]
MFFNKQRKIKKIKYKGAGILSLLDYLEGYKLKRGNWISCDENGIKWYVEYTLTQDEISKIKEQIFKDYKKGDYDAETVMEDYDTPKELKADLDRVLSLKGGFYYEVD